VATFFIGLLPTYEQIGIWAPIALVVLRLAQGFGVGGEWGGAVLMAVEHAPPGKRGFYGSWPQIGVPAGLLVANGVFFYFSGLPDEQFLTWGWRVPFLLSIFLVFVGLLIRMRILETPAFARIKETSAEARQPIVEVIRMYPKQVLLAMGARFAENGGFYIYSVFVITYATQVVKFNQQTVLYGILIGAALELLAIPFFGALSDRVGRRPVYLFGAIVTAVFAYPLFWLIDTGSTAALWSGIAIAFVLSHAAMYAPQAAFLAELFGARVRYSGASLGAQLASVFAGALAPLIATGLLRAGYGGGAVALYVIGLAVVTIVSVVLATETHRDDIE
jgi:MFS transporter, MHS family, shikimate and dehydroshikimate transport protein